VRPVSGPQVLKPQEVAAGLLRITLGAKLSSLFTLAGRRFETVPIFRHQPPGNSGQVKELGVNYPLIVQNFGQHGSLLHEFSSLRMPPGESIYASWERFLIK
jgi:hypothetical protein